MFVFGWSSAFFGWGGEIGASPQRQAGTAIPGLHLQDVKVVEPQSLGGGKAEYLWKGENPRFVVTSLSPRKAHARRLYEKLYCASGEMENRIKEQQLDLFAARTSARDAGEPVAVVLLFVRLCIDAGTTAARHRRHAVCTCPEFHDPSETIEDLGPDQDHGPTGVAVVLPVVSVRRGFCPGAGELAESTLVASAGIAWGHSLDQESLTGATPRMSHARVQPSTSTDPRKTQ